ncbi:MAG: hypothetical protein ACRCWF_05830 [Beijerinckiaceae bacterium]
MTSDWRGGLLTTSTYASALTEQQLQYPANWRTIEDEELPVLDVNLVARAMGSARHEAIDRMTAMVSSRLERRMVAYAETSEVLKRAGVAIGLHAGQWLALEASEGRLRLSGDRRRSRWQLLSRISDGLGLPFGKERRVHDLTLDLAVHWLAVVALQQLERHLATQSKGMPVAPGETTGPAEALMPLQAMLFSLFSGFNAGYILTVDPELRQWMTAAAWLGWKIEGREAPLPDAAMNVLCNVAARARRDMETVDPDVKAVIELGLDIAGIDSGNLERSRNGAWPTPMDRIDLRPRGPVDVESCLRLALALEAATGTH